MSKPYFNSKALTAAISGLETRDVYRVYSGKPGCGCGCRGTYASNPAVRDAGSDPRPRQVDENFNAAQVTRVVNQIRSHAADSYADSNAEVIYWETEQRYYWAYLTDEGRLRIGKLYDVALAMGESIHEDATEGVDLGRS